MAVIVLSKQGHYRLIETKRHTKILYLGSKTYAWVELANIGEILIASHREHKTDSILSQGAYRLYDVKDESKISDHIHLELEVGEGVWQGYILLSGLPNRYKARVRIIPTKEVVTTRQPYKNKLRSMRKMAIASG